MSDPKVNPVPLDPIKSDWTKKQKQARNAKNKRAKASRKKNRS
jgi:hypothetical protein